MNQRSCRLDTIPDEAGLVATSYPLRNLPPATLWIVDDEPVVASSVHRIARQCGIIDTRIFHSKRMAIQQLRAAAAKPVVMVTDYRSGEMRGDEFIRLARQISPRTKLILFSAVLGSLERWIKVAGFDAPSPDVIIEKPDTQRLMTALGHMT